MKERADAKPPQDEIPEDLAQYVEAYRAATAAPSTARLRQRLEAAGAFRSPRRQRLLLRAAGLLLLVGAAAFGLTGLDSGPALYAQVEELEGQLQLDRDGQTRPAVAPFAIRVGDVLVAGEAGCRMALSCGARIEMRPAALARCVEKGRNGALDFSAGGVRIVGGRAPLQFVACGESFRCVQTSCSIERCCPMAPSGAVKIRPDGPGLYREQEPSGPRLMACEARTEIHAGRCTMCGRDRGR